MDSTLLRLILLAAGILFLAGIYFWESGRRKKLTKQARTRETPEIGDTIGVDAGDETPGWTPEDADTENLQTELAQLADELQDEITGLKPLDGIRPTRPADIPADPHDAAPSDQAELSTEPLEEQQELFSFSAREESPVDVPSLILQINIMAKQSAFAGPAIEAATKETGLQAGEMQIYHRYTGDGRQEVSFNMASMVEPGVFPLKSMDEFTTPGLTLFAQLPGPGDGMAIFSDMLFTAQRLAAMLGGELRDETHSALSKQTIEHMRGQILEHRRLIQLARSRR